MMGCVKVNVCWTDSLGRSGKISTSLFDTDYRFVYMNSSSYVHVSSVLKPRICRHAYVSLVHTVVSVVWLYRIRSKGVYLIWLVGAQKTMTIKNYLVKQHKLSTMQTENTHYPKDVYE